MTWFRRVAFFCYHNEPSAESAKLREKVALGFSLLIHFSTKNPKTEISSLKTDTARGGFSFLFYSFAVKLVHKYFRFF